MEIDWKSWDIAIRANGVIIDRARETPHPRFPASIYPVDYGYIPGTAGGDGGPVDIFVGTAPGCGLIGLIVTRDALKGDQEIKLLWNMTEAEIVAAMAFLNRGGMTGWLIERPQEPDSSIARLVKRKAFAYITHRHNLLLFRHPAHPAGVQVPGGTVMPGEDPTVAVLREAHEETGHSDLTLITFLGAAVRAMDDSPTDCAPDEVHHRYFYHLQCGGEPPLTWRHHERFGPHAETEPIAFDFFWAELPDGVPELIADQGQFIPQLLENLQRHIS